MTLLGTQKQKQSLQRQIEILSFILDGRRGVTKNSVMEEYAIESAQLNRDKSVFVEWGVSVYSSKGVLHTISEVSDDLLVSVIENYLLLRSVKDISHRAIFFFVQQFGQRSLSIIVQLVRAITAKKYLTVCYAGNERHGDTEFDFAPLLLFEAGNDLRLYGYLGDKPRQLLLQKCISLSETGKDYPGSLICKVDTSNSLFRCWIGEDATPIVLRYSKQWLGYGKLPQLCENQEISHQEDGSVIVKLLVSDIDDVARWLAGRGDYIQVMEPAILIDMVLDYARATMGAYKIEMPVSKRQHITMKKK